MAFSCLCCCHSSQKSLFHQQNKSSESKLKFRQATNGFKRVLKGAIPAYTSKTKESITSQKRSSQHFWQIANTVLNKSKCAISPLFNRPEVSPSAKLFAKNFSKSCNLDDSGISLPVFSSRTNLKLHNISVTTLLAKRP